MAATWTATPDSSVFGQSWVADMGPYIGPATCSVDWLPPDCQELDFYVGTLTGALGTGSWDGFRAAAYRARGNDGTEQTGVSNAALDPGSGSHLYVQWTQVSGLPPTPNLTPEQVVPCIYVRGGRGPYFDVPGTAPGNWSDWQPGYVASSGYVQLAYGAEGNPNFNPAFNASLDTDAGVNDPANAPAEGTQYTHPPLPLPLPDRSLVDLGAESLARQRAGSRAGDLFRRGGINQVFAWKRYLVGADTYPYDPTFQLHHFEAFTRIDQAGRAYVMPDTGLGQPPGISTTYEYEGGPTGTVYLPDQAADIANQGGFDHPGYQRFQSGTPLEHTATETFEIWAVPGLGPGADGIRVDPTATGIKLLEFELSAHLHADGTVSYDPAQRLTIPYSMIPSAWAHFTLIYQPRLFRSGDGASLWYDIPTPDPTNSTDNGTYRAYQYGIVPDTWLDVPPTYEIRTPRFRYWIPGRALRCCPNQRLRITSRPGSGRWSDWINGDVGPGNLKHRLGSQPVAIFSMPQITHTNNPSPSQPNYTLFPGGAVEPFPDTYTMVTDGLAQMRAGTAVKYDFNGPAPTTPTVAWYNGADDTLAQSIISLDNTLDFFGGHPVQQQSLNGAGFVVSLATFQAYPNDPTPDVYSYFSAHGLRSGTDYGPNPDTGLIYDLDPAGSTFLGWDDWNAIARLLMDSINDVDVMNRNTGSETTTSRSRVGGPELEIRFRILEELIYGADELYEDQQPTFLTPRSDTPRYIGVNEGTVVAHWIPSGVISGDYTEPVTIPLSGVSSEHFTIAVDPTLLARGDLPFDAPYRGTTTSFISQRGFQHQHLIKNIDVWYHGSGYGSPEADALYKGTVPTSRYRAPRWRYWIPANDVEIPTCVAQQGGHWGVPLGDFSGARLTQLRKP